MGILNVTPDSFSDGGKFVDLDAAISHAVQMATDGADIIDVGGESTRPGADVVPVDVEIERVVPVIRALKSAIDVPLSIDTRNAAVAEAALDAGADWINDVSALTHDPDMVRVAADAGVRVVLMHMVGTPETMQSIFEYKNVVEEVRDALIARASHAEENGVSRSNILLDPGIGFGKSTEHNLALIREIETLRAVGYPVLVGASRKRFIGDITGRPADERVFGTAGVVAWLTARRTEWVRVHDVAAAVDVIALTEQIANA